MNGPIRLVILLGYVVLHVEANGQKLKRMSFYRETKEKPDKRITEGPNMLV